MKFATRQLGFKIVEVPITFTDRVEGTSKMSKNIVNVRNFDFSMDLGDLFYLPYWVGKDVIE